MHKSRVVHLLAGQNRVGASNSRTVMRVPRVERRPAFEDLFVGAYDRFAATIRDYAQPGIALVAVDSMSGQLAGVACAAAKPGMPSSLLVGRHARCDLFVDGDPSVALRHLAVVVEPVHQWRAGHIDVAFRVLDLRTESAFGDEHGEKLRGLRSEGPAILTCGRYALFVLVTGDPTDFPESARDAWSFLPERVYLSHALAAGTSRSELPEHRAHAMVSGPRQSTITRTLGPWAAEAGLCAANEEPIGHLEVRASDRFRRLSLGEVAADAGVLLGRYPRCDGSSVVKSQYISRVHLLLLRVGGRLYAFDTASTRGSFACREDGTRCAQRVIDLTDGTEIELARGDATVRFCPR